MTMTNPYPSPLLKHDRLFIFVVLFTWVAILHIRLCNSFSRSRLFVSQSSSSTGRRLLPLPTTIDNNSFTHRNVSTSLHHHSVINNNSNRLLNNFHNNVDNDMHHVSNETINNGTESTTIHNQPEPDNDTQLNNMVADTIVDDLTRGFIFAALFCFGLYCLHKVCVYICVRCGCCPDERIMQARMRKLRLMRKRSYNYCENNTCYTTGGPPLDTRKWAQWMMVNRGIVDTVDDTDYYYSAVNSSGIGRQDEKEDGVWDTNTDDDRNCMVWDDETGFVDFEDTAITNEVELACRSNTTKSTIAELEYGEGEELEDESHDSRLFDAEDGGEGVIREANKFFMEGHLGRENGKTKDAAASSINKRNEDRRQESNNVHRAYVGKYQQNNLPMQTNTTATKPPAAKIDTVVTHNSNVQDGSLYTKAPQDPIAIEGDLLDNILGEDMEMLDIDANNVDADNLGYDEESDLLGLRSVSPPPLDVEEMSKIEKKLMENANNIMEGLNRI